MLSRVSLGRGNSPPARTSSTYHSGSSRHTVYPHSLYLQHAGFSTIFTYFCRFSPDFAPFSAFLAPWPHLPGGTRSGNTETRGPGARAGRQRRTQAACGRRRTARPPRPGAPPPRAPGGAAPNGGAGARRRATAGRPARQERAEGERIHRRGYRRPGRGGTDYPEPPERAGRRRGGRRVGDSGAGGQRPGGPAGPTAREKRAGREPTRPAAYRDSRRPRPARGRGEPLGAPRPEHSGGSGGGSRRRAPGPNATGSTTPPQGGTA